MIQQGLLLLRRCVSPAFRVFFLFQIYPLVSFHREELTRICGRWNRVGNLVIHFISFREAIFSNLVEVLALPLLPTVVQG